MKLSVDPDKADALFLYYVFCSAEQQDYIHRNAIQTGVPHTNLGILRNTPLTLPPLREQRAAASLLGSLDDKIELNRRMNATLEAMARALFQDRLANSDRIGSILEQADLMSGGTPKTSEADYWDGTILWASAKDVSQCGDAFLVSTDRTITERGLKESATKLIPAYSTIVVARGATTGRLAMLGGAMAMNQTCYALRSNIDAPFALYCSARNFIDRMVHAAHGSVFDTVTTRTFETTDVPLPDKEAQYEFEKVASPLFRKILANLRESRTLAALRDTLLPKLLSGEIRVKS
jgi:type I restriction enzyme S subunit